MKSKIPKETITKLTQLQHQLFEKNVSTLILFEGAGGLVMSNLVNEIVNAFEPRNINYSGNGTSNRNWMFEEVTHIPPKGKIGIYDRSWYSLLPNVKKSERLDSIGFFVEFEKYLANNGVNIIKIFLNMEKDDLKKFNKTFPVSMNSDSGFYKDEIKETDLRLSNPDVVRLISLSNTSFAPWNVVEVKDYKKTVTAIAELLTARLTEIFEHPYVPERFQMQELYPNPREGCDYDKFMSDEEYDKRLKKLQKKLAELQLKLSTSDKSMMLAFEGWDAAGKGGVIRRITSSLNPRGYTTVPVPAPTKEEKSHTHLWRFFTKLPEPGHITIFDRSWYGRMMVEPIEGFCTEDEYSRAGQEINMFEAVARMRDTIVLKFWIDITPEVQLERFNARAADPLKQWKLTDEDWRNREKWDVYEKYVNSMIRQTNTPEAPWIVVENNDKKYGRIKVFETIIDVLEKELKK